MRAEGILSSGQGVQPSQIVVMTSDTGDGRVPVFTMVSYDGNEIGGGKGLEGGMGGMGGGVVGKKYGDGVSNAEKLFGHKFEQDPSLVSMAGGKTALRTALMAGRKCTDLKDYLNNNYKFSRPKQLHQERLKRTLVYGNALVELRHKGIENDDLKEGYKFFENSWGMGPFYCYPKNFDDIQVERERLDAQIGISRQQRSDSANPNTRGIQTQQNH